MRAFGGHIGSGIPLISKLVCTPFVGAAAVTPLATDYGYCLMLIQPDLFVPLDEYQRIAQELLGAVKSALPELPGETVQVPGECSFEYKRRALKHGLQVPNDLVTRLTAMVGRREVEP